MNELRAPMLLVLVTACGRFAFDPITPNCEQAPDSPFSRGDGSSEAPFEVCGAFQLDAIGQHPELWDRVFRLDGDINLDTLGGQLTAIGTPEIPFTGSFDGGGRTIKNLRLDRPLDPAVGLFARVKGVVTIRNVVLGNVDITGGASTGALIGDAAHAQLTVSNITVTGTVRCSGADACGGVIGRHVCELSFCDVFDPTGSSYSDLRATVTVIGGMSSTGGIIGYSDTAAGVSLARLSAAGRIEGRVAGGLIGNLDHGVVTESSSTADVVGQAAAGGLVGGSSYSDFALVSVGLHDDLA